MYYFICTNLHVCLGSNENTDGDDDDSGGSSIGAIAGGVIGGIVVVIIIIIIIIVIYYFVSRKNKGKVVYIDKSVNLNNLLYHFYVTI